MHSICSASFTWNSFFCNLFIFPRTDVYIHDSINIMFQCTKLQCKNKLIFIAYCFVITFEIQS
jgi:hypothetical protein